MHTYIHMLTFMHAHINVTTLATKKEAMDLKENKEKYMRGFGERNRKGEIM